MTNPRPTEVRPSPRALVVYESMFGNTEKIATAVADGLREAGYDASAVSVTWTAPTPLAHVDLLVAGAPTHAFSLSRPSTRQDAVRQGAPATRAVTGLREWLTDLRVTDQQPPPPVAVFDTRIAKVRRLPASAARTTARLVRRRGLRVVGRPEGFLVRDTKGPLVEAELQRATAWGRRVAQDAAAMAARCA